MKPELLQKIKDSQAALLDALGRAERGEITTDQVKPFGSFFGVYPQRDGRMMTRVRQPGAEIPLGALKFLALLFLDARPEFALFSTRQNIQAHGLTPAAAEKIVRACTDNELPFRGGGGDTFRSVSVTPESGVAPGGLFDLVPYARFATETVFDWDLAFALPRKIKIAFAAQGDEALALRQDLGFVAATGADGARGFVVYGGGGFGRNPALGVKLFDFLPEKEMPRALRAMIELFSENGNRKNRAAARLRHLKTAWGDDAFRARFREYFDRVDAAALPPLPDFSEPRELRSRATAFPREGAPDENDADFVAWKKLAVEPTRFGDDFVSVRLFVPDGRLTPEQFAEFAAFVEASGVPAVRLAFEKNVLLPAVPAAELPALYAALRRLSVDFTFASFVGQIDACVGAATCKIGMLDTPKYAREVALALDAFFRENPEARTAENVRAIVRELRFSGCPNSCTSHQAGRFGFNGFKKMLDGKMTEGFVLWERPANVPAMGADTGRFIPVAELPDAVVRLVRENLLR
ncbi:MAG: hypothetical protein ACI4QA_03545 [Candidatus Spyradosoma sp.]